MIKNTISILLLLFTFYVIPSQAHTEHEEIQVQTTFEVNNRQQLSAISMVWIYDTFSSTDMLSHEKDINRLAKILISDLSRFNFLTRINIGDRRIVANRVNKYRMIKIKDRDNNPALQLSFTLLLNKPIAISKVKNIKIDHSDPTGKGILFYDKAADISLTGSLKSKCRSSVKEKKEFIEGQFPQIATVTCGT